ncbi:uncharacterized protein (TIGR02271 family) [Spirosoma lacussanchae]|uniref:YsnF/AvaK domain-containing protein n=1 Tax=Spirosoma lacussanchae TaxID=1884249 RepID=UPI00110959C4|nr:YsnF/AvaK domain-containing protein [Spirosoma lacussanchae]
MNEEREPGGNTNEQQQPSSGTWITTDSVVIPVIEEQLRVETRQVETGRVRLIKAVQEVEETVAVSLTSETVDIERVPVNQTVAEPPPVRYEGDTTVYPVLKEILVIEKRLMLVEEVRVTRRRAVSTSAERASVRQETIVIERSGQNSERPAPDRGPSL